ncbi:MAG: GTP-binding protein [Candidatus Altiarchaeales archaeon]|nr:MAG: GTP-binding protein [Candidatus Altiarchaeales archaeon]
MASTIEEKIKKLEEELRKTPYNKATQHHIGRLKAKLAKLRDLALEKKKSSSLKGFAVKKQGDATVALVGFPSVGKSTLLNKLTNAESKVAEYEFTTLEVIPGMLTYKGAKIQILDIPGLIGGASIGKGRGKEVISVIRNSDLILIMLDFNSIKDFEKITAELYNSGIRLNKEKPNVKLKKTASGGINIFKSNKCSLSEETIKALLNEYGIYSGDITIMDDITIDDLIDVLAKNRVYIPALVLINKIDMLNEKEINELRLELDKILKPKNFEYLLISAEKDINLSLLKEKIFQKLNFIRVYLKPRNKPVSKDPVILRKGSTIADLCRKIHSSFEKNFLYAKVYGSSVKFPGQKKGLDHKLEDGDVVTIFTR